MELFQDFHMPACTWVGVLLNHSWFEINPLQLLSEQFLFYFNLICLTWVQKAAVILLSL